jgi:hypothetical protein
VKEFWDEFPADAGMWREILTATANRVQNVCTAELKNGMNGVGEMEPFGDKIGYWGCVRHRIPDMSLGDTLAAAALARFEKQKTEPEPIEDDDEIDSGSGSEFEDEPGEDSKDAVDVNGKKLLNGQGRGMVKVCEDEDADDPGSRDKSRELQRMIRGIKRELPELQVIELP